MNAQEHMFRYGSVQQKKLLYALKHNKRELQSERGAHENIDVNRMHLNYVLHGFGNSDETYNYARSKIALAGIHRLRKNAVLAIECIFSLPVSWHDKDSKPFFFDCFKWLKESFEGVLLSFDIHLDEAAPHAHALILPLVDSKLQGDAIKGGKAKIAIRQKSFYEAVAVNYGFKNPRTKRLDHAEKEMLAKRVMSALKTDPVYKSKIFAWVRDSVFANPIESAQLLGIPLVHPKKELKHFVDYKRSRGHGAFEK